MKKRFIAAAAAIVGALVACATGEDDPRTPTTTQKSAVSRDLAPSLTPDELDALSAGQAEFAVSLYHAIANARSAESVFLSPHSASIALGMAYAGARGTTASEMRTALHLGCPTSACTRASTISISSSRAVDRSS